MDTPLREHGHAVKLMAPPLVKPYVRANKHDLRDADAMAEAVTRPTMRFVAIQSVAQQDLQALHRVRERLMQARTALLNETRGLLHEYGMIVPQGAATFRTHVRETLATDDAPRAQVAQTHPVCQRLMTIPGLGELPATALVAAVSDAAQCKHGRQFAVWLGLVPRHQSTGGKSRLLGISTHGDRYLRNLLVHGARSCLRWVGRQDDRRSQWVRSVMERRGWHRATVALATKNARVAWGLMGTEQVYRTAAA